MKPCSRVKKLCLIPRGPEQILIPGSLESRSQAKGVDEDASMKRDEMRIVPMAKASDSAER